MFRHAFTALFLLVLIRNPVLAGDSPAAASPEAVEKLLIGKSKPQVLASAGTPDHMSGVGTTEEVPMNFSQQWVHSPPRALPVAAPATGAECRTLRVWFGPNDRVERVTFEF
jgi:hypothetical protein